MTNTIKLNLVTTLLGLCLLSSSANAGKLYKWVDAQGNVSYQDKKPPKGSKIISEKEVKSAESIRIEKQSSQNKALPSITIYTVDDCDVCERFVTFLQKNKVPHIERPLKSDRDAQSKILERTGSLRAPSLLIGDSVFQKKTVTELSKALSGAGYSVNSEAKPATVTPPRASESPEDRPEDPR